jgi:hypothetical protein
MDQLEELLATDHPFHRDSAGEGRMNRPPLSRLAVLCAILCTSLLSAADFSTYREFQFGASLATAAKEPGVTLSEVRLVHQRPALIEELDWRPSFLSQTGEAISDPVRAGLLRFYNGQLFQIVITYDRYKVEGMTAEDMVEVLSPTYGDVTKRGGEIVYNSNYGEVGQIIARWESPEHSCTLVRSGDQSSFVLILSSKSLDALAQTAIVEATRLDLLEAPQRAIELREQEEEEDRLALEKARSENMPNFRP